MTMENDATAASNRSEYDDEIDLVNFCRAWGGKKTILSIVFLSGLFRYLSLSLTQQIHCRGTASPRSDSGAGGALGHGISIRWPPV